MTDDNQIYLARINGLEKSIADTRKEFIAKIERMEIELMSIRQLVPKQEQPSIQQTALKDAAFVQKQDSENSLVIELDSPDEEPVQAAAALHNEAVEKETTDTHTASQAKKYSVSVTLPNERIEAEKQRRYEEEPVEQKEPGFIELMIANFFHSLLGWLVNTFTAFKAPFQDLFQRLLNLYQHYQKQGKAPVFLMTVLA